MKTCFKCGEQKPLTEFWKCKKSTDGYNGTCVYCMRAYQKDYYTDNETRRKKIRECDSRFKQGTKDRIKEILRNNPCLDCGFSDIRALQFDHVRDTKLFEISVAAHRGYSWSKIEEEINKCEIVCANCHSIRTAERRVKVH